MKIRVYVNGLEVQNVSELRIQKEMNSSETCTFQSSKFLRIGQYVVVRVEETSTLLFSGYINNVRISFDKWDVNVTAISSPILNKIMQTKIKVPKSDTSWGNHLMTLLRLCGATLTYDSEIPTLTPGKGEQLISENKIFYLEGGVATQAKTQGGRNCFHTSPYQMPTYDNTGNVTSYPLQPTIAHGLITSGIGNYNITQEETSYEKDEIEVDFQTILKNIEKETGKKLFYTVTANKVYIGVQGSYSSKLEEEYISSLEITEDASQVVESIANMQVVYNGD